MEDKLLVTVPGIGFHTPYHTFLSKKDGDIALDSKASAFIQEYLEPTGCCDLIHLHLFFSPLLSRFK